MELNGQCGLVVPQGCSITPDVPGCLKVRLEYGREVAVKPQNLQFLHIQQQQQQQFVPEGSVGVWTRGYGEAAEPAVPAHPTTAAAAAAAVCANTFSNASAAACFSGAGLATRT